MSIGSTGSAGHVAGTFQQQAKGSDNDRSAQDVGNAGRAEQSSRKAESAAGVGETAEDQEAGDRDADGRRLWERQEDRSSESQPDGEQGVSKDPTGNCGNNLDLSG